MKKYYVTNDLAVDGDKARELFSHDDETLYAAPQYDNADCLLVYAVSNGDPVYLGWYDRAEEVQEFTEEGYTFDTDAIISACKGISNQVEAYNSAETVYGWLRDVRCYNPELNRDVELDVKLVQQALNCRDVSEGEAEYMAHAVASNGKQCRVRFVVDKDAGFECVKWGDLACIEF